MMTKTIDQAVSEWVETANEISGTFLKDFLGLTEDECEFVFSRERWRAILEPDLAPVTTQDNITEQVTRFVALATAMSELAEDVRVFAEGLAKLSMFIDAAAKMLAEAYMLSQKGGVVDLTNLRIPDQD